MGNNYHVIHFPGFFLFNNRQTYEVFFRRQNNTAVNYSPIRICTTNVFLEEITCRMLKQISGNIKQSYYKIIHAKRTNIAELYILNEKVIGSYLYVKQLSITK